MEPTTEYIEPSAGGRALAVLAASSITGALAGWGIGATRTTDGGFFETQWAVMTEQPLDHADKVFNWLLLAIFVSAGIIAAAVTWAGTAIVNTQLAQARYFARTATRPPSAPPGADG